MTEYYKIPFQATIYSKLRSFQFKINHNILYCNKKLYQISKSDTDKCTFCNEHIEDPIHLFTKCTKIKPIWKLVLENLLDPYGIKSLSDTEIILGVTKPEKVNNIVNHIIIETKYYIYVCKLEKTTPDFARLKNRIKITEYIERQIAYKKNKVDRHDYKWHHLLNYLLG